MEEVLIKALSKRGFSVVEVLSPCPTNFGRQNKKGCQIEMMKELKEQQGRIDYIRQQLPKNIVTDIEKVHVWRNLQASLHDKNPDLKGVEYNQSLLERYENALRYQEWYESNR